MHRRWQRWNVLWAVLRCVGRDAQSLRCRRTRACTSRAVLLCVSVGIAGYCGAIALAQEPLGVAPPGRQGPMEPSFPDPQAPVPLQPPIGPLLPPVPPETSERLPMPHVFVQHIQITGNTVFAPAVLAAVTSPYVQRQVTSEELEALRLALTRLYVNAGYINSGAILPDQTVAAGVITFHIIEGELTSVRVEGNRWFSDAYLRKRLALHVKPPLHIGSVQERLQLLQQDDRIERLDAELRPGVQLGESELHVRVTERLPFAVALEFNNYQSSTIGAERGLITVAHRNLTGHGDILRLAYGRSAGLDLQLDASYTLPLSPRETTFNLRYRRNAASVVEERFASLDITSEAEIFSLTLRHPFYRTLRREFALALIGERLQSRTFLLGEPFAFTPGTERGVATDTAVRVALEWLDRTPEQVIAVLSRFSFGVDVLGATRHRATELPDGRFFAWLGQLQAGWRLPLRDIQLLVRVDSQLTNEPLLPLEQIAVGGRFSVRGYQENQLVRDNGLIASLESRIPLIQHDRWAEFVQVVPFVDVGWGWNQKIATPDPRLLISVGLGVRWAATWHTGVPLRSHFEVFWGQQLKAAEATGGGLQAHGLHMQFVLTAF